LVAGGFNPRGEDRKRTAGINDPGYNPLSQLWERFWGEDKKTINEVVLYAFLTII
jgi:hypothetical protein